MGIAFTIIGGILLALGLFFSIKTIRVFRNDKATNLLSKKQGKTLILAAFCMALAGGFFQGGIQMLAEWHLEKGEATMAVLGAGLFFMFFFVLWESFYLRFYCPHIEVRQMKIIKIALYGSIPLALFSFLMMGEGVGNALSYPLVCGFAINGSGWHWITAANANSAEVSGGLSVRWYGVVIVFGALVCYWVSDHKFYQKYGKHGILETLLLFAFPGGILGARIWYVVGNWNRDGFASDFSQVFRIWDGGLTIMGGAVGGILVGVAYALLRLKWVDIRFGMDVVVPTILLGQAIGRWGNFFNFEVYGAAVLQSNGWNWLPTWVANQMAYGCDPGYIRVPLFLVESALNIFGYFLIAYIIPSIWKKNRGLGVLSGCYLVWYGVVRIIMEPLRDPNFNMGTNGTWSIWNALAYILLGAALIAMFQIFWVVQKGKTWSRGSLEKAQEAAQAKPARGRKEAGVSHEEVTKAPEITIVEKEPDSEPRDQ